MLCDDLHGIDIANTLCYDGGGRCQCNIFKPSCLNSRVLSFATSRDKCGGLGVVSNFPWHDLVISFRLMSRKRLSEPRDFCVC